MKRKDRNFVSVITLLMLVFSLLWMKPTPEAVASKVERTANYQIDNIGPAGATSFLVEVKSRFTGTLASAAIFASSHVISCTIEPYTKSVISAPPADLRPLWLMNRSLLI